MAEITLNISDDLLTGSQTNPDALCEAILLDSAIKLFQDGKLSAELASQVAGLAADDFSAAVRQASATLSHALSSQDSLEGSRYLARVLWALVNSRQWGLESLTAAEIAKFVSKNSEVRIEETNTARFFRDCRKTGKYQHYWSVNQDDTRRRYAISAEGLELFKSSVPSASTTQPENP